MTKLIRVSFSGEFIRLMKSLRKKYRYIQQDIAILIDLLERGETPGDRLQGMGEHIVYKTRVSSRDMQRGKSGGFRVIYYIFTENQIFLITVYTKSEQEALPTQRILALIAEVLAELAAGKSDDDSIEE